MQERKMEEGGNEGTSTMSSPLLGFIEQESSDLIAEKGQLDSNTVHRKKHGGWKTVPFILGNESFERLASFGLTANFMVYLTREFHMEQVAAANMLNIWHGANNFVPLLGAYIADAYAGRFLTIAVSSFFSLLGMIALSLTAWTPGLHPPHCTDPQQAAGECVPANKSQLAMLILALALLSLGSGGLRPCSAPFGVDQFDPKSEIGKRQLGSFFNWYYATSALIILFSSTVMVYIQDAVSWKWGFGIPTACMFCSIVLFFLGMRLYVYVNPEGSIFSSILQVSVAAYAKRKIELPIYRGRRDGVFYNPLPKWDNLPRLPYTHHLSCLSKAAVITEGDYMNPNGEAKNNWRLCTIQQVEEVKCIVRIIPVWASGIISYVAMTQQGTFLVSQALKMDRHFGSNFQIPAASMSLLSYVTLIIWIPFYDRLVVPSLRKITRHKGGITVLQRVGVGIVFSILTMVVSGLVEKARRDSANKNPHPLGVAPMSIAWLAPQLVMMGFCEAFYIIGQVEFFNMEFPEHFKTLGNSLFSFSMAGANFLSALLVMVIHRTTKTSDGLDWLTNDINKGRLDYYFYLIAALGTLNLFYFIFCARRYHYKGSSSQEEEEHYLLGDS